MGHQRHQADSLAVEYFDLGLLMQNGVTVGSKHGVVLYVKRTLSHASKINIFADQRGVI